MKKNSITTLIIAVFLCLGLSLSAQNTVEVTLTQKEDAPQISKHIYGHFAEHLGRCIYDGFYVGEDSSIPNTNGVRNDIIEALKDLKVPNLRWPGGCFADTYHWKDGIGPKEDRPTIVNQWWGGSTEDNSFGTHDFLNLCEALNAEPYLAANVGSGTVQEFAEWLQYVNHDGISPMAKLRRENGREKPWNVRIWGVGNEMWGCGGNMRPEYYADVYRKYATFMTDWTNSNALFRVASGANSEDYHWTEVLMRDIPKNLIDGVALHHYCVLDWGDKGPDKSFTDAQYFKIMQQAIKMDELITKHTAIMDKYDAEHKIALVVDEWGGWYDGEAQDKGVLYQQNTMRDAMIAGVTLNIFNNWADRVKVANLAQTVNVLQAVILTEGNKMLLTPTYHVMKMYNVHQDATLMPVSFTSPQYTLNGQSLPAVSISASYNAENEKHISLVNIDPTKEHTISIDVDALKIINVTGTVLTSSDVHDYNSFDNPSKIAPVAFKDFKLKKGKLQITVPALSVVVLEAK
ncbi:alpha-N-arabinofuranosidase [Mangrovimonas sp. DI 80]|uniref:alpha-N-arabinofuranosidase n=1 Tax=Mangrovimonas sp. DI 80 TaxID=1779330 RepID=UPI000977B7C6|nr:alpha-L-arabinofuranosidase C-terminal domain-containing protein [Mangrovimonas sp. DI 80]OMP30172.1 alpha-N-arabinofuranosidase [Mangrovimonas sp. DI 80]